MLPTTIWNGINPAGKLEKFTWLEFKKWIYENSIPQKDESERAKRNSPSFACVQFDGGRRLAANIRGAYWSCVLDVDKVLDQALLLHKLEDYEYIAWTTWKSTPAQPRWRVVLLLREPVAHSRLVEYVNHWAKELEECAVVDVKTSTDSARLWFAPWHRASAAEEHRVWDNQGRTFGRGRVLEVDFTGVSIAGKPSSVEPGERNMSLARYLRGGECARCETEKELRDMARAWNEKLTDPMEHKEWMGVASRAWRWWQGKEGARARLGALPVEEREVELIEGTDLFGDTIISARKPVAICGDILYPGATILSAKMKEGKSFLTVQLLMAIATGGTFLDRFAVHGKRKVCIIAGEDTPGEIRKRYLGAIDAGILTRPEPGDVRFIFQNDLEVLRKSNTGVAGAVIFEKLVAKLYADGVRVISIDPLRVLEGALDMEYEGVRRGMNIHAVDFHTMRFYTRLAQKHQGLCLVVSLHHGKSKRDQTDPQDMIAGTTGMGAGAISSIAIVPLPLNLAEDAKFGEDGRELKRRELYIHGRHTKTHRLMIEQDEHYGIWKCTGEVNDTIRTAIRARYLEAISKLGGRTGWVTAEQIAKEVGVRKVSVHKILARMRAEGVVWNGFKLVASTHRGYRLS